MTDFSRRYGSWAVIAGGSDGVGAAFADGLAARGMNLVLVARRTAVLDECAAAVTAKHPVQVRTVALDLAADTAIAALAQATADLEIGVFVYNAGSDTRSAEFLDRTLDDHRALVQRNCVSVLEAAYRFGGPMVTRGRGAVVLVTSGAAWAGGRTLSSYGATKAFDLVLGEGLWAEWRDHGVDVLSLVLGATDTPSLHRTMDPGDRPLADPRDVAEQALDHLADGPTWIHGSDNPTGGSPFGSLDRRSAVLAMSTPRH
ncbi:SDR family NAD(P)-dependent oxidoreductase [Nocardia sp. alder85J]|uniref:SDR family NAD(P)-dependent oxidoreductase n=1 Tax=Nocardia sp. alder85J TaxID=2862949 RepID=UPI001CD241EF|nr:SDR family NAD(P)-dependent oxidoreductase [Nocardia sp. alder85J]MCX4091932.1 SDR family NAD(P)-dependent oxidoreductase [Nocardia sp. alder85J]